VVRLLVVFCCVFYNQPVVTSQEITKFCDVSQEIALSCDMLLATCDMSHATYDMSHAMCDVSHATYDVSQKISKHILTLRIYVLRHVFFSVKMWFLPHLR
jgi:hypothetical protein